MKKLVWENLVSLIVMLTVMTLLFVVGETQAMDLANYRDDLKLGLSVVSVIAILAAYAFGCYKIIKQIVHLTKLYINNQN